MFENLNPPYKVILADPPWQFKNYSDKWHEHADNSRWVGKHYPLMNLDSIKNMNIQSLSDKDCCLFLWGTWCMIEQAFAVMNAWGFTYKTGAFTWIKINKDESPFVGLGHWTRQNDEFVLLGTRGNPKRRDTTEARSVKKLVFAPRGKHSEKPDEVNKRIETLVEGPYLELFARRYIENWDVWGGELE